MPENQVKTIEKIKRDRIPVNFIKANHARLIILQIYLQAQTGKKLNLDQTLDHVFAIAEKTLPIKLA